MIRLGMGLVQAAKDAARAMRVAGDEKRTFLHGNAHYCVSKTEKRPDALKWRYYGVTRNGGQLYHLYLLHNGANK